MDNHHNLMFKLSRLFPTSCHFRTLPDVAQTSISNKLPNPNKINPRVPMICNGNLIEGRKCPPVTKMDKLLQHKSIINHSSSSHSGWFTSSDEKTRNDDVETDTLFSFSSNSGDSFRLKTSRRFRRCDEKMKSIDETARCSFSSTRKTASRGRRRKTWPETELGPDHISTQLYYNNDSGKRIRRRKAAKSRRKTSSRRSLDDSSMIGESYAVEKTSKDPRSDFRASMVEMIVEKQIFAAEDLKRLLLCFLSLNAVSYHGIIFDVFNEICQTLFAN